MASQMTCFPTWLPQKGSRRLWLYAPYMRFFAHLFLNSHCFWYPVTLTTIMPRKFNPVHQLSELTDHIRSRHYQSLQELVKGSLRVSRISTSSRATPDFYRSRFHTGKLFNPRPPKQDPGQHDGTIQGSWRFLEQSTDGAPTVRRSTNSPRVEETSRGKGGLSERRPDGHPTSPGVRKPNLTSSPRILHQGCWIPSSMVRSSVAVLRGSWAR